MMTDQTGDSRGGHPRSRIGRRLIVLGALSVLVLAIPGLRSAADELLVGVVTLIALFGLLGLLALAIAWRVARRHPVADVLVAAWLLRRHERRQQRIVDARSWSRVEQPYEDRTWPPGPRPPRW